MRIGEGNARFLADLHTGVSDEELRARWVAGEYGKPRTEFVMGWRKMAGRDG